MHDGIIHQQIPGGCSTPDEQVGLAEELVRSSAEFLTFLGIDELEHALAVMHEPLVHLAAAGVLKGVSFFIEDSQGLCGIRVIIDLWEVSAFEEVDLSSLRLLANSEAPGTIEIALSDSAFAEEISGSDWLPEPSEFLLCTLVTDNETTDDVEQREEDGDEYDDDEDVSEYADDGDKLLG